MTIVIIIVSSYNTALIKILSKLSDFEEHGDQRDHYDHYLSEKVYHLNVNQDLVTIITHIFKDIFSA